MAAITFVTHRTRSLSWLVAVCAVLAVSAGVLSAFGRLPLPVIVAPVGLASMVVLARRPELALALLPMIGVLVPLKVGTGSQSPIVAALMVAILLVLLGLLQALRSSDWSTGASITVPAVLLMLVWVFALLWSNVDMDPLVTTWSSFWTAQIGGTAITIISAGVLLVAQRVGLRGPWIEISVWSMVASGAIAFIAFLVSQQYDLTFPFETGGLFTMWVVALALGQALFNNDLRWPLRATLLVLAVAWEVKAAFLQTWWFSGWLPPLVVAASLVFLRSRKLFAVASVIAGAVFAARFDAIYATVWGSTVDKGDLSRLDIWQQTFDLFGRHPLLGTGPAGYAVYFQSLYAGSSFSMSTHNNYLDVLVETGIIGAVAFVWLLGALLVVGLKACYRWRSGFYGGFANSGLAGLFGVLVAMGLGDWFIPFVYNQTIAGFRFTVHSWVFLGFLSAMAMRRGPSMADRRSEVDAAGPRQISNGRAINRARGTAQP